MQTNKTHWPSILIIINLALSAVFLLGIVLLMGVSSIVNLMQNSGDPAGSMIVAFASGLELTLLITCGWFISKKTMHRADADLPAKFPYAPWQTIFLPALILVSILIGAAITSFDNKWLTWFLLPLLTLIAVAAPILFVLGIGTKGIELGPRWRVWSTLGIGLTLGPVLMFILELFAMLAIAIIAIIILSLQPDKANEIKQIAEQVQLAKSNEAMLRILAPYIATPGALAAIFGLLSIIVPFIEELLKPLAVWLFASRIEKPSQGFALGMLSGAAFALVESFNVSGDGSTNWSSIVGVRAATSLLHITTAGLMGFAIVSVFREKRFARFIATCFATMTIHGLWNACAAGASLTTIGELIGKPEWLSNYLPAAICGLAVLGIGMFAVLITANRKLRASIPLVEVGVQ